MKPGFKHPLANSSKPQRKGVGKERTGSEFEKILTTIFDGYKSRGIATVEKVEMPVKVFGPPKARTVIFLENPWLDFSGTWTVMGGRHLVLEAKATQEPRLAIGAAGITPEQMTNLLAWHDAGAAVAVLWYHQQQIRVITGETLKAAHGMGVKSFKAAHYRPAPRGEGFILFDFLDVIARQK